MVVVKSLLRNQENYLCLKNYPSQKNRKIKNQLSLKICQNVKIHLNLMLKNLD